MFVVIYKQNQNKGFGPFKTRKEAELLIAKCSIYDRPHLEVVQLSRSLKMAGIVVHSIPALTAARANELIGYWEDKR